MPNLLIVYFKNLLLAQIPEDLQFWLHEHSAVITLDSATSLTARIAQTQAWGGLSPGQTGEFDECYPDSYSPIYNTKSDSESPSTLLDRLNSNGVLVSWLDEMSLVAPLLATRPKQPQCICLNLTWSEATLESVASLKNILHKALQAQWIVAVLLIGNVSPVNCLVNVNTFFAERGVLKTRGEPSGKHSIVWPDTLAYQLGHGQVHLNLYGREQQGIVTPGKEYDQVRDAIIQILTEWQDPTLKPIVKRVYRKEEVYHGPHVVHAPDLLIQLNPGYAFSSSSQALCLEGTSLLSSPEGMTATGSSSLLSLAGHMIRRGIRVTADLLDVSPTLAYLAQQPIMSEWQGRIITAAIEPHWLDTHPVRIATEAELSSEDQLALIERLRALGYIS